MPTATRSSVVLLIAYIAFVSLGLPDTLIGVAWPSVRDHFHLHQRSVGLVFLASGTGYFLSGFFTGRILHFVPIGLLLAVSSALVATASFGFAAAPIWALFVVCAILHGLGSGAIDGGLNNFAATHFSARQMNWLHACYMIGATLGPLIMTAFLSSNGKWRAGYAVVATIMLLLATLFLLTRAHWQTAPSHGSNEGMPPQRETMRATLGHPTVWLQTALFFVYTGLEVTVGQWTFTLLTESREFSTRTAGLWVTLYWGSIGIGRVLFGFFIDRIGIDRLIRASTITALCGTVLIGFAPSPFLTMVGLMCVGVALAPIYPSMMTRTPQRIGPGFARHAIGFQVAAAMLGAATLPSVTGIVAQSQGLESIPFAAVSMAFVLWLLHEAVLRRHATTAADGD